MFLRKLSFAMRLFLTSVVFAVPVVLLTIYMFRAESVNIDFGSQEAVGTRFQRPTEKLLQAVIAHKLVAQRALNGEKAAQNAIEELGAKTDTALKELTFVYDATKVQLDFSAAGLKKRGRENANLETLTKQWTEIRTDLKKMPASVAVAKHQEVITTLRTMINHAGDTSNLILDPDLDSYYLMDSTVVALPQIQDRLQDIVATIEPMLRRRQLTLTDQVKIAVFSAMLKEADLGRINASSQTALNEDPNFYGPSPSLQRELPPKLEANKKATEEFIAVLDQLATPGQTLIAPDVFVAKGEKAILTNFDLWWTSAEELDHLLNMRVSSLSGDRTRDLYFSFLALFTAVAFSLYVGRSLTSGIRSILDAVQTLRREATSARDSSEALVDASQRVSSATTEQGAAVQETVATLNQISAMVEKSVHNAHQSAEVAANSHSVAGQGKQAVDEMMRAIKEIDESNQHIMTEIDASNRRISDIVQLITEIGTKTKVINDIVFQTKLLSFNASVEAARAGEHGKGFAVVAEEVGNLAQMSGNAANEINQMLSANIGKVNAIVDDTKRIVEGLIAGGRAKVESGMGVAERCDAILEEVVKNAESVKQMVEEISESSKEQASGVEQISLTMNELDSAVQQNAQTARQTSEQASQFKERAEQLTRIVSSLESELLGRRALQATQNKEVTAHPKGASVLKFAKKAKAEIMPTPPKTKNAGPSSIAAPRKTVATGGTTVPSENDPRFKDV